MKVSLIKNTLGFSKPFSREFYSFCSRCVGHSMCGGAKVLLRIQYECYIFLVSIYYGIMTSRETKRKSRRCILTVSLILKSETETLTIQQIEKGQDIFVKNTWHVHVIQWLCGIPWHSMDFLLFGYLDCLLDICCYKLGRINTYLHFSPLSLEWILYCYLSMCIHKTK